MTTSIQLTDLDTLAGKLADLDLNDGERDALDALLTVAGNQSEVAGFMLQKQQQTLTGPALAGILTGSGRFSMAGAGSELFPFGNDTTT